MQIYQENQMQETLETTAAIMKILEQAPDKTLSLDEILKKLNVPSTNIHAREVIWKMLDRNELRLTPERKLMVYKKG